MRLADPVGALNSRLLSADSATRALRKWCDDHRIGGDGPILAKKQPHADIVRPDDELLNTLLLAPGEVIQHRRVTLSRSGIALSDCDLWWMPSRLGQGMAAELDNTDSPFGTVVAPLHPTRHTLYEAVLPTGHTHILEHRALVISGVSPRWPIAAVRELYRTELIEWSMKREHRHALSTTQQ